MASPPPNSLVPAPSSVPTVWPPSNPSGTVIPFPLPWGQTGCCPPGGMDALMKCYCDLQQASAFIGQVMLDQINNNPAIIAAIIAALEKSGSSVPLIGVTDGSNAQPGQVGEFQIFTLNGTLPTGGNTNLPLSMGVLPPGDWDCWAWFLPSIFIDGVLFGLQSPQPPVASNMMQGESTVTTGTAAFLINSSTARISIAAPTLIVFTITTGSGATAGTFTFQFEARRAR